MNCLTNRDREYLRIMYFLHGKDEYVGPVKLANVMGISKVCAFQKMHRLSALGYGSYKTYEGLKLNEKAIAIIENDMRRHHIIESFLQEKLNLSHNQACREAELLTESMSTFLFQCISKSTLEQQSHCCEYSTKHELTPEIMQNCPWVKKSIKI